MDLKSIAANVLNTITGGVIDKAMDMVDKMIPDKNLAMQLKDKLDTLRTVNDHELEMAQVALMQGQIEVNKVEAASPSIFVSGWRPAIGWICAGGIAYDFIVHPMALFVATLFGVDLKGLPGIDVATLMSLVIAMLGLAGYRTYEKREGVAASNMETRPAA